MISSASLIIFHGLGLSDQNVHVLLHNSQVTLSAGVCVLLHQYTNGHHHLLLNVSIQACATLTLQIRPSTPEQDLADQASAPRLHRSGLQPPLKACCASGSPFGNVNIFCKKMEFTCGPWAHIQETGSEQAIRESDRRFPLWFSAFVDSFMTSIFFLYIDSKQI